MNDYTLLTDDQLVSLYVSGQDNAFDVLLERYKNRLYNYILYIVHKEDTADDLFQETFVKAIVTLRNGNYRADGKFYAWLTRIAHNLLIDHFRDGQAENFMTDEMAGMSIFASIQVSDACKESEIVSEQTLEDVRRLIEHLPESQKEVVKMRYYQDLSFKEIADLKGISINTALGRMHYAINNMRKMAKEHGLFSRE